MAIDPTEYPVLEYGPGEGIEMHLHNKTVGVYKDGKGYCMSDKANMQDISVDPEIVQALLPYFDQDYLSPDIEAQVIGDMTAIYNACYPSM